MKKSLFLTLSLSIFVLFPLAAKDSNIQSVSKVDWISKSFESNVTLDAEKSGLIMPAGKKTASVNIKNKMPELIQRPLLTLFLDNRSSLGDEVMADRIKLDDILEIIEGGHKTPDIFTHDAKLLTTTNTISLNTINQFTVRHKYPQNAEEPIDEVPSRVYSGIIIDARGALPVQGEYVSSETYPCFYPEIWDEDMELIFEKNNVNPKIATEKGIIRYDYSDDFSRYNDRIGFDPLYIKATKVYGRNRTDPIIKRRDALKILSVPENRELLKQGKVVILLDKENLQYTVSTPDKDPGYYVKYREVKQYIFENKMNIEPVDGPNGILFSVDLKFYPDSPELLPSEAERIQEIARLLSKIMSDDSFTILIEGHTADVGKPVGQLNLSIDRTRTVMEALIEHGLDESLFTYKGYGGTRPVAENDTEEGRAQNRRVDITARPRATYIQRDYY